VRRLILLMATMAAALVAASGVAYAVNMVQCDGTGDQDPDPGQCQGTDLSDVITGTAQTDLILALGGFDEVFAGGGQDELNGGTSADTLRGEAGSDTYNGGGGNDWLDEATTSDVGNDVMNGGGGTDFLDANQGNDILRGQAGDDNVICHFCWAMLGGAGDDELYGGDGEDGLSGGAGTDKLIGGGDNDQINAADGEAPGPTDARDIVNCGPGIDIVRSLPNDRVRNCEEEI
jgi:Ca2+-binding RTX toxin-like protein